MAAKKKQKQKQLAELKQQLDALAAEKRYLWMGCASDRTVMGFVLEVGERFALLQRFNDFEPDGFVVVALETIEDLVWEEPSVAFLWHMMREEGLLDRVAAPFDLALTSPESVLSALKEREQLVLTMGGELVPLDDEYPCGLLQSVDEETTRLLFLTAWGEWWGELELTTAEVVWIQFGSPYLTKLQKYAQPIPDPIPAFQF